MLMLNANITAVSYYIFAHMWRYLLDKQMYLTVIKNQFFLSKRILIKKKQSNLTSK